jgi:DNA polymerase-3 subunit delta
MPFLLPRRVVVITHPLTHLNSKSLITEFKNILANLPNTTALILVEHVTLKEDNWLISWARSAESSAYVREFSSKKGGAMVRWIQDQALTAGGEFSPRAAVLLASLVGEDTRMAYQEIQKLLAYARYQRPVEPEDVEKLTALADRGDIFALVDALGNQNARKAFGMLLQIMVKQDPLPVFGMIVRQFRLLLLAREVLDAGGREREVARILTVPPYKVPFFVAQKVTVQSRHFTMHELERVYHRLLDIDEAIKSGKMAGDLALDTLVAALTTA